MGNIDRKMQKNLEARQKEVPPAREQKTKFHIPGSRKKKGK